MLDIANRTIDKDLRKKREEVRGMIAEMDYGLRFSTPAILAHTASYNHNLFNVLLKKGIDVNGKDSKGITALQYAAVRGDLLALETLLDHGVDVHSTNYELPFRWALRNNHFSAAQMLLDHGGDINEKYYSRSALLESFEDNKPEAVKFLLLNGADVNDRYFGTTLLYKAINNQNVEMARLLLAHDADTEVKVYGKTLLQHARESNNFEMIELLSEYTKENKQLAVDRAREEVHHVAANIQTKPDLLLVTRPRTITQEHYAAIDDNVTTSQNTASSKTKDSTSPRGSLVPPPPPTAIDVTGLAGLAAMAVHATGLTKTKVEKEWEKWSKIELIPGQTTSKVEDFRKESRVIIELYGIKVEKYREKLDHEIAKFTALSNQVFDISGLNGKENYRAFLRKNKEALAEQRNVYDAIGSALVQLQKQIDSHSECSDEDIKVIHKKFLEVSKAIEENQYKEPDSKKMQQEELLALKKDLASELKGKEGVWGGRFGSYVQQRDSLVDKIVNGYEKLLVTPNSAEHKLAILDHIVTTVTGADNVKHVQEILQKGNEQEIERLAQETLDIVRKEILEQKRHQALNVELAEYEDFPKKQVKFTRQPKLPPQKKGWWLR